MTYAEATDRWSRWFLHPRRPDATATLFCLPHSGGGATAFRGWPDALPSTVDVRPLQLPGREARFGEPADVDVAELAAVVAAESRPFALYGHSFGALLAFELTHELRRRGARLPERLFVGACRPPGSPERLAHRLLPLTDLELLDALVELGGTPAEIRDEPALVELVIPPLRADLGWLATYRHEPGPVLPVPVVTFAGTDDQLAPAGEMTGWEEVTSAGCAHHALPGGHFFPQRQLRPLAQHLVKEWPVR